MENNMPLESESAPRGIHTTGTHDSRPLSAEDQHHQVDGLDVSTSAGPALGLASRAPGIVSALDALAGVARTDWRPVSLTRSRHRTALSSRLAMVMVVGLGQLRQNVRTVDIVVARDDSQPSTVIVISRGSAPEAQTGSGRVPLQMGGPLPELTTPTEASGIRIVKTWTLRSRSSSDTGAPHSTASTMG
ncbi:hypothetical protein CCHR01_04638 [Colletotrichum chrysophilum]|uniref:Uncharacterized protein n=1 Tax=Colletotrichum chrysophilum TaxID=1836956 RepID=A0AAD9EMB0_9PEZI|nr:hypothetical protein CCHR01_04638 [Colletotrichum chrysophilum]